MVLHHLVHLLVVEGVVVVQEPQLVGEVEEVVHLLHL